MRSVDGFDWFGSASTAKRNRLVLIVSVDCLELVGAHSDRSVIAVDCIKSACDGDETGL